MIADLQFGTHSLQSAIGSVSVRGADIERLDATGEVPLQVSLWLGEGRETSFRHSLLECSTVEAAREVVATERGALYQVRYDDGFDGVSVYRAAVKRSGLFLSGRAGPEAWTLQLRFPDRDAVSAFCDRCEDEGVDVTVQGLYEGETTPRAEQFDLSPRQREILILAAEQGYFEVPRQTSLSGLATDIDISSQAASERLRRGLDSLVEQTLLTPE